jgi:hypothetical protein
MKDHIDKFMGIVTRTVEDLDKIKLTESLRLSKSESHKKLNCSDTVVYFESTKRNPKMKPIPECRYDEYVKVSSRVSPIFALSCEENSERRKWN